MTALHQPSSFRDGWGEGKALAVVWISDRHVWPDTVGRPIRFSGAILFLFGIKTPRRKITLHHFGSVTQKDMKQKLGKSEKDDLVSVNDRYLLQQGWLERKIAKFKSKKQSAVWRAEELATHGMTLHGERLNHAFI